MEHSKSLKTQRKRLLAESLDGRAVGWPQAGGELVGGSLLRYGGRVHRHVGTAVDQEGAPLPKAENRKGALLRSSRRE